MKDRLIEKTKAICRHCQSSHDAELSIRRGRVEARVLCPEGVATHLISTDPEKFLEIRKRSCFSNETGDPEAKKYVLNYISITNACNFACKVCGADAKAPSEAAFLSVEEVLRRAGQARKQGAKILHLIGGEPTLHPQLLEIVAKLSAMGFSLGLATNGYRLGKDDRLAEELRNSGLKRICLQFDSFDERTLVEYGRNTLAEKQCAVSNALAAGLNVSFNCTVSRQNLQELPLLLQQGFGLGAGVKNMTFATAAPTGRFTISENDVVDREQVIDALLKAGGKYHFSFEDFLPLPTFFPWGLNAHPDCGVHVPFLRTPKGVFPLNRYVDMRKLYSLFSKAKKRKRWFSKVVMPALCFIRAIRPNGHARLGKALYSILLKRNGYSLVNVSTSDYRAAMFLDEKRVGQCATAFHSSVGAIPGCLHFFMDEKYSGSRQFEVHNGGC